MVRLGIQTTRQRQRKMPGWWSPQRALDGVLWRHGEHASSDVPIAPGCLQQVAGPVWFVSVSHKSAGTHLGVEGPEPSEGQAVFKCTRLPAGKRRPK